MTERVSVLCDHSDVCFFPFVHAKAINDWASSSKGVGENFTIFLQMNLPWKVEADDCTFDPCHPKARHIEGSPLEKASQWQGCLEGNVFAPIIMEEQEGLPKLLSVAEQLSDAVQTASEDNTVANDFGDVLENVLLVCKALPAIGSRQYGIMGSTDNDVEAFTELCCKGWQLLSSIKQNTWWASMLEEHERCVAASRRLRPRMTALSAIMDAAAKTEGQLCTGSDMVEAMRLMVEAKESLRPTQADSFSEKVLAQVTLHEANHLKILNGDGADQSIDAMLVEAFVKQGRDTFGESADRTTIASMLESRKHELGQAQRLQRLAADCQAWLADQKKEQQDPNLLKAISVTAGLAKGMQTKNADTKHHIGRVAGEIVHMLRELFVKGRDDPVVVQIRCLIDLAEVAHSLVAFAPIDDMGTDEVDIVVQHRSEFFAIGAFFTSGPDTAARVLVDRGCKNVRASITAVKTISEAIKKNKKLNEIPRVQVILNEARDEIGRAADIEIPKATTKLADALKPLTKVAVGEGIDNWFTGCQGDSYDALLEHAQATILVENPTTVQQNTVAARKELDSWVGIVDSYAKKECLSAPRELYTKLVELGEETYVCAMCCTLLLTQGATPLKLRRNLKAQKETLSAERWSNVPPALRNEVDGKLAWQREPK